MELYELWARLPRWVRACVALSILLLAGFVYSRGFIWPWAWGVGGCLLLLSIPRPMKW